MYPEAKAICTDNCLSKAPVKKRSYDLRSFNLPFSQVRSKAQRYIYESSFSSLLLFLYYVQTFFLCFLSRCFMYFQTFPYTTFNIENQMLDLKE